jgi:cGMP-dependent protein kinase
LGSWSYNFWVFNLTRFLAGFVPFGEDLEDPTLVYKEILKKDLTFPDYFKDKNAKKLIE